MLPMTLNAAQITQEARVEIVKPITLSSVQEMDFGELVMDGPYGSYILHPGGTTGQTGGVTQIGAAHEGIVDISAHGDATIQISVQDAGGSPELELSNFGLSYNGSHSSSGLITGASPAIHEPLKIGAKLSIRDPDAGVFYRNYTINVDFE